MQAPAVGTVAAASTPRLWGEGRGRLGMVRNLGRPSCDRRKGNQTVSSQDKLDLRLSTATYTGDTAPYLLSLVQSLHDRHFRLVRSLGQLPFLSGPQFPHLYNGWVLWLQPCVIWLYRQMALHTWASKGLLRSSHSSAHWWQRRTLTSGPGGMVT